MDELPAFTSLSMVPFETLIYGLIVVLYGLFFWVMNRIHLRKKEMVSLFNILVLSASIQVIFGLLKLAQGNKMFFLLFYPIEKSDMSRFLTGTLGNANHFAFFLEMIIPVAMALFFYRLRFFETGISIKQRVLSLTDENKIVMIYFISIALMGIGILLTGTRAGIVTMILLFILFTQLSVYLKQTRGVRRKMIWILVAISGLVLYFGIQNTVNEFKRSPIAESGRFVRWPDTVEMVKDFSIFGTGFGTYRYSFYLYDSQSGGWSTHAHNDILEILAEGGVIGGLLFYALIGLLIVSIIRKWIQRHHPDVRILGLGIIVSIFAVIFHSIFDFSLRIPSNMLVFVLILVLGMKIVNYKRRDTFKMR
jgi:O-antigen ligase